MEFWCALCESFVKHPLLNHKKIFHKIKTGQGMDPAEDSYEAEPEIEEEEKGKDGVEGFMPVGDLKNALNEI